MMKNKIEKYMKRFNKSLYEVALDIGLSETTLWKCRNGYKISEKNFKKINDFLTRSEIFV